MSQRFPAYTKYKTPKDLWIGDIPEHWEITRSKNLFRESSEVSRSGEEEQLSVSHLTGVTSRSLKNVTMFKAESYAGHKICRPGDLVINTMWAWMGALGVSDLFGLVSPSYGVYRPKLNGAVHSRYYDGLLRTGKYVAEYVRRSTGIHSSRLRLYPESFLRIPLIFPPLEEQAQIARFLDHETAKIDALIEKQQQLIALLEEKRQAVISHAVTKGLDPDVPMRDSGVEWLGQVPAHWDVCQLKHKTLEMQTGPFGSQLHARDYVDGGIPLINPAHLIKGEIVPEETCSVDLKTCQRLARHRIKKGDVIFARRGDLGRCAVARKKQDGWLCGTGSLKATLSTELLPNYAFLLISSKGVKSELLLESRGSTMENLNTFTLGRVRIPFPPTREQESILAHVDQVSGSFDRLQDLAKLQADLLKEKRTALISAAVTGKIDVRGWKPPESTSETTNEAEAP